ncbi:MAG: hypothetical protein WD529_05715 [Balneolaceae bacterium]
MVTLAPLFLLAISACTTEVNSIPPTGNASLDVRLAAAPVSVISLHEIKPDTVFLADHGILGREKVPALDQFTIPGRMRDVLNMGRQLFILDGQQDRVWVMSSDGVWTDYHGQSGRGPGDLSSPEKIYQNSSYLFIEEFGNGRLQIFDHAFQPLHSIELQSSITMNNVAVNDSLVFLPLMNDPDGLIQIRSAHPPFIVLDSFWPHIIPAGMMPGLYNWYHIDTNDRNDIAIVHLACPIFFCWMQINVRSIPSILTFRKRHVLITRM